VVANTHATFVVGSGERGGHSFEAGERGGQSFEAQRVDQAVHSLHHSIQVTGPPECTHCTTQVRSLHHPRMKLTVSKRLMVSCSSAVRWRALTRAGKGTGTTDGAVRNAGLPGAAVAAGLAAAGAGLAATGAGLAAASAGGMKSPLRTCRGAQL